MATLNETNYGFRFPEITNITTIGDARYNNGFDVTFRRVGNYNGYVLKTYVLCLVGTKGEQLDYANPEDPRWRVIRGLKDTDGPIDAGKNDDASVHLSFDEIFRNPDTASDPRWQGDLKNHNGETRRYAESISTLRNEVLKTKRPIHFAIFERVSCSYNGLTELYFRIADTEIRAYSLKNQVLKDTYYNEMDEVWPVVSVGKKVRRVAVDLAQRLKSDGTGRFQDRVVYVSTSDGYVYCYDYWTGSQLAKTESPLGAVELNALAVDPFTGYVWTAIALGNGKIRAVGLKRKNGVLTTAESLDIKCPNDKYTKKYKMIPSNMTPQDVASRITGGVVTNGANGKRWFTFVVNKEATISVSTTKINGTDSKLTYKWADRMHFGAWHGINANWCATRFNGKTSYKVDAEYGVDANTDNVIGICAGVGKGAYVNGHTYYHEDWRYWNDLQFWGYTQDGTACGGVFSNLWYPSYAIDFESKQFVKDEKTGKYLIMWASTQANPNEHGTGIGRGVWTPRLTNYTLKECKEHPPYPGADDPFHAPSSKADRTKTYWMWSTPSYSVPLYSFWMRYPADPSYKAEHRYPGHEDAKNDNAHWCDYGIKKSNFKLQNPQNYSTDRAKELWQSSTAIADDFGNVHTAGGQGVEAKWSGDPAIDYENSKYGLKAHIEYSTMDWKYNLGSHWYQLQDLGFIYCGNASLGNSTGDTYTKGCADAEFFRSTGVCEDHPVQLTGVNVIKKEGSENRYGHFDYHNTRHDPGDIGLVTSYSVNGFSYQKAIANKSTTVSNGYFNAFCPATTGEHTSYRKIGSTYGWRGVVSRTAEVPKRWGSSEDWNVNKAGFNISGGSYNHREQPSAPRMSLYGLEQRLEINGSLLANTGWEIVQTDVDHKNKTEAYFARPLADAINITTDCKRSMNAGIADLSIADVGIKKTYDVSIDDVNRLVFSCEDRLVVDKCYSADGTKIKYKQSYAPALKQFTSFGNHKNTWQITEAYQLATSSNWTSTTWSDAYNAVRTNPTGSTGLEGIIKEKASFGEPVKTGLKSSKMYNMDPTGMDGIKCLGYCYTLRTQAHPLPTPPDGRLLVISSRVRNEVDCYIPFWQKSIIQPAKFEDISKKAFRGGDTEVDWYHRSRSSDDWQQTTYIGNAFYTSGELYDNHLHSIGVRISGASTTVDTVMEWGLSAAGYDHLATRHLMDVFSSGSYWPDEFILEFKDTPQRNKDYAKRSTKITFTDIQNVASGFYQHYENPDAWNGITVYGKPIQTKKDPEGVPTKVHRWGQNVPTKQYQNFEYSSIHPDVYTWPGFPQEKSSTGMYVENNNYGPLANAYGHGTGWSKPNTVSFSAVSYDYPYGNPEVPGSDTMVFYFGMNDIHVYERWSTPAMCATSDDPSGGLSLWGECE